MRVLALIAVLTAAAGAEELSQPERDARAHAWFERGRASFKLGYFAAAVEEFEQGYKYLPHPLFIYNIAQSARRAGQVQKALDSYRAYLKVRPDAPERKECEQRIAELEKLATPPPPKLAAEVAPSPAPVAAAPSPAPAVVAAPSPKPVVAEPVLVARLPAAPAPGRKKTLAGAILAAVGVGALGGGLAATLVSSDANDQIHADTAAGHVYDPSDQARGRAANSAAAAMFVIGGAALVTGVVVLAVAAREARPGNRKVPIH
jgi:tetratricopeptide (TPR) repeat protein